jgi:hypothetical protein
METSVRLGANAISFDIRLASFVEEHDRLFANKEKIAWNLSVLPKNISDPAFQSGLLDYRVVVVPYRSYFYY